MAHIHEKIVALLEQRQLKKRDLARALKVSPQTATDICKGRSAITLPHLRNLVSYFGLRADYWLDDQKLMPEDGDATQGGSAPRTVTPGLSDPFRIADPDAFLRRIRALVAEHRQNYLAQHPDLPPDERTLLGLAESGPGMVGRIPPSIDGSAALDGHLRPHGEAPAQA